MQFNIASVLLANMLGYCLKRELIKFINFQTSHILLLILTYSLWHLKLIVILLYFYKKEIEILNSKL